MAIFDTVDPACNLPIQRDSHVCSEYVPSWGYNTSTGQCEQFIYGGCDEGNDNKFLTEEACMQNCNAFIQ